MAENLFHMDAMNNPSLLEDTEKVFPSLCCLNLSKVKFIQMNGNTKVKAHLFRKSKFFSRPKRPTCIINGFSGSPPLMREGRKVC
jgi:hypothetical protein